MKRFFKGASHLLIISIVSCVVLFSIMWIGLRASSSYLGLYKDDIQSWLSEYIEHPITIKSIDADWQGLNPVIILENIELLNPQTQSAITRFDNGKLSINLIDSLFTFMIQPEFLSISGLKLELIRRLDGSITIQHATQDQTQGNDNKQFAEWLLSQKQITLNNAEIKWLNEKTKRELILSNVIVELKTQAEHLLIDAQTNIDNNPDKHLNIKLDITDNILSSSWDGEIVVNGNYLPVSNFFPALTEQTTIAENNFTLHSNWDDASLQDFRLETMVRNAWASSSLNLISAEIDMTGFRNEEDNWKLEADIKELKTNNSIWPQQNLSAVISVDDEYKPTLLSAKLPYLELGDIYPLLSNYELIPVNISEEFNTNGQLKNIVFNQEDQIKTLNATIAGAMINHNSALITNINGDILLSHNDSLKINTNINSGELQFNDKALFHEAISFNNIASQFEINKQDDTYSIDISKLNFHTPDYPVSAEAEITYTKNDLSPFIKLNADIAGGDLNSVYSHLPKKASENLFNWLKKSIQGGTLESGNVSMEGFMHHFPFDKHEGAFDAVLNIADLDLKYNSKWPAIKISKGALKFNQANMIADVTSASIMGATLENSTASLTPIKNRGNTLIIDSVINGKMKNLYAFLRSSPLANKSSVQKLLDTELTGKMGLDINLSVPFDNRLSDINGKLFLKNTRLSTGFTDIELSNMQGAINFNKHELSAKNINATYKGYPVTLDISPEDVKQSRYVFTLKGHADENFITQELISINPGLMKYTDQIDQYLNGSMDWSLAIKPNEQGGNHLAFSSDLQGLEIKLPYPAGKLTNETSLFILETSVKDSVFDYVDMSLNNQLHSYIDINTTNDLTIQSIDIALGKDRASKADNNTVNIHGAIDKLDVNTWTDVLNTQANNTKNSYQSINANLDVQTLNFNGIDFKNAVVNAKQTDIGKDINLQSDYIDAQIFIPNQLENNAIDANIKKFIVHKKTDDTEINNKTSDVSPSKIPALNIKLDSFIYDDIELGNINIKTRPDTEGMRIEELIFDYNGVQGNGNGYWHANNNTSKSNIDLNLTSDKLSDILNLFGTDNSNIKKASSSIAINMNWAGAPMDFSLQESTGQVSIDIDKGSLLDVDSTAGRLFGLLSITSLPRRLAFDFSDIFGKGYAFDELTGNFEIDQGHAYTTNMHMRGPSATIDIIGRTGLHDRDYDQTVVITPKVSNSLPLAGALFGPIGAGVGAVVYMAGEFLEGTPLGFNKILSYKYSLTGPWEEPVFEKIKVSENSEAQNTESKKIN